MKATETLQGPRLEALLLRLPSRPGVYLMKDVSGRVVYVGKAKNLKTRVRSYFRASGDCRAFVSHLNRVLGDIELVVTPSEKDALILERELIGHHRPRYNIDLRDDKNFLCIRITGGHRYPRLLMDRRRPSGGKQNRETGRWFGPYPSAAAARETSRLVQSTFQLRTCPDAVFAHRSRPCLQYQMGRCLGPCAVEVDGDLYAARVNQAVRFLRGRLDELLAELEQRMKVAAAQLRFEDAAKLRDRIRAAKRTLGYRQVFDTASKDRDVVGIYREGSSGVILLMQVRQGRWLGATRFPFQGIEAPEADIVRQFLSQHYDSGADLPEEILLPEDSLIGAEDRGDRKLLEEWLSERKRSRVRVVVPKGGNAALLVKVAGENATEAYRVRLANVSILADRLERLKKGLGLCKLPRRIECFDLSTLGGRLSVGSMAVLLDGEPATSAYRRYRIREAARDSDVAMMREVVGRRFRRVAEGLEEGPDLVVLDGGRGQLKVVLVLFADLGITDVDLVALAKGRSERPRQKAIRGRVFVPGRKNPILLRPESDELFLLSRVRDEAHRFAVGYHRKLRRKTALRSVLDEISGVGPVMRRRLLVRFGSLKGIEEATAEELAEVPGVSLSLGRRIHEFLARLQSPACSASGVPTREGPSSRDCGSQR